MTEKEEAKHIVNIIYQPTGYLNQKENSVTLWEWSCERAIEMVVHFIEKMPEGSNNWLRHHKIIDEIKKLK